MDIHHSITEKTYIHTSIHTSTHSSPFLRGGRRRRRREDGRTVRDGRTGNTVRIRWLASSTGSCGGGGVETRQPINQSINQSMGQKAFQLGTMDEYSYPINNNNNNETKQAVSTIYSRRFEFGDLSRVVLASMYVYRCGESKQKG